MKTLKVFIPTIVRTIKSLTESDDFLNDEIADSELLFNFLLLTDVSA